jgi:hypothetical protein
VILPRFLDMIVFAVYLCDVSQQGRQEVLPRGIGIKFCPGVLESHECHISAA